MLGVSGLFRAVLGVGMIGILLGLLSCDVFRTKGAKPIQTLNPGGASAPNLEYITVIRNPQNSIRNYSGPYIRCKQLIPKSPAIQLPKLQSPVVHYAD